MDKDLQQVTITSFKKETDKNGKIYYWGHLGFCYAKIFQNKVGGLNLVLSEKPRQEEKTETKKTEDLPF